ncbi:MAG TPA: 16S rRNA (cytosine(1402)-N(4))-methyltransferase RsmH [Thermomicrobiales bacterium]|nr:16S rRNA (cytosine(1402)-N(4))-methyltransferase RsmH [Thermomicrobiales bacterium]
MISELDVIAMEPTHRPVLLTEAVDQLVWRPGGVYVDGTFGGGGHTREILSRDAGNRVIAFDLDLSAIDRGRNLQQDVGPDRLTIIHDNFATMASHLDQLGIDHVDGVLLDLGMSSFQLDDAERGFAFRFDGPLDMRFDQAAGPTAAELIATTDEAELADIIWRYGEERRSRQIARALVAERDRQPIETTGQLAGLVARIVGRGKGGTHPATRTFQALRIAVNREFDVLERALESAVERMAPAGRLVVIAFHSLEDRIVKQFIVRESATCVCPPEQVICTCETTPRLRRLGSSRKPSAEEQSGNPRSRSAVMRVAERLVES